MKGLGASCIRVLMELRKWATQRSRCALLTWISSGKAKELMEENVERSSYMLYVVLVDAAREGR